VVFRELKAAGGTGKKAGMALACLASAGINLDMYIPVYIILINGQFIFDAHGFHIAFFV
jgi:hypothetical protein